MNNNISLSLICEKLNIPLVHFMNFPYYHNTNKFPHPLICCKDSLTFPYNKFSNNFTWEYANRITWLGNKSNINKIRYTLKLKLFNNFNEYIEHLDKIPQIYTMSKYFLGKITEWENKNIILTGFLLTNSEEQELPKQVKKIIENKNKKIVFISFGSATININYFIELIKIIKKNPNINFLLQGQIASYYEIYKNKYEIIAINNNFFELYTNIIYSNIYNLDNIHIIGKFPHDILFKYVDLVIGSGGIGTIINSLKNYKPVIVVPITSDQYFNGNILKNKNMGFYVLKNKMEEIHEYIHILLNSNEIKNNIIKFANQINNEPSVKNFYEFIKQYIN
jgi:UDP:flavonoid glycosyltransferase YjiC (YdhE family)